MTGSTDPFEPESKGQGMGLSKAELEQLIEEATVDAFRESEQMMGFYTMLDDHLAVPFQTRLLGVTVTVERLKLTNDEVIVAICTRGQEQQEIPLLDLPLPKRRPEGAEWIDAFRYWARGQ
jgi:hypothetical protein